jgi:serine/threonine-protein kinase HipA
MTEFLEVYLGDRRVGSLALLPAGGSFFAFEAEYLNDPAPPVLSQSFFRPSGEIVPESKIARNALPPFFSNLLPEGPMREYLARQGGLKPTQEYRLLALLGRDLPGAVRIVPATEPPASTASAEEDGAPARSDKPYRFSLAGVQLKFSAVAGPRGGLTVPASGVGGDWIVKLPSFRYPHVPENERAIMRLAGEIGIPVPETRLIDPSSVAGLPDMGVLADAKALAVRRFDRRADGTRIHMEDFAQVYGVAPSRKYEGVSFANIARMVWTLCGEAGMVDFVRRLAFTILTGNGDMHLKNWSLLYEDGRSAALAPAYDLLSTVPYIPGDSLALSLSGTKNMAEIGLAHFAQLAEEAELPERLTLRTVKETTEATLAAWEAGKKDSGLPPDVAERIDAHMANLALTRG